MTRAARPFLTRRTAPRITGLEARLMFDAAAAVDAVAQKQTAQVAADAAAHAAPDTQVADTTSVRAPAAPVTTPSAVRELVFVDTTIDHWESLVPTAKPGLTVVLLQPGSDPWTQMTYAVSHCQDLQAIHLLSHGSAGQLIINGKVFDSDTIAQSSHAQQLQSWASHLTADADILLYGCSVADLAEGRTLIDTVARLTGADVTGSTDATGNRVGENWLLERTTGDVGTRALDFSTTTWTGELTSTVYNANQGTLNFDGTNVLNITGNGTTNGSVVRFNNVITINGQAIDAVVTTTLTNATISSFDSTANPSSDAQAAKFFQPNLNVSAANGGATFKIDFYKAGTYTGTGTGAAVTLQNVVVNSYDIDSAGSSDRQFQEFKGFSRYEVSANTTLATTVTADGSVHFQATTNTNNSGATLANLENDGYRVKVYYDSISSFQVKTGVANAGSIAYFALDFSVGMAWTGASTSVGTPAANLTYDTTTLTEANANDGSIGNSATITLTNSTFTGTDGQALSGVTVNNVPAGLAAAVTRVDATHATLTLTGNATNHANANDIGNLEVVFGDAAFTSGNASVVTGATRGDVIVDFSDPTGDTTPPAITGGTTISYAENRASGATLGTVTASDAVGVTGWRFASTGSTTSSDGYFAINASGQISLTAAGAAAGIAANDYETTPNSFTHAVQAGDAAGNWSTATAISLTVTDVDDTAPIITGPNTATGLTSAKSIPENTTAVHTFTANESVTWAIDSGADAAKFTIDASGHLAFVTAPDYENPTDIGATAGNNTYVVVVKATDTTGNATLQTVTVTVTDVNETPANHAPVPGDATDPNWDSANGRYLASTPENTPVTGHVGANDADNDALTYAASSNPAHGTATIDPATGAWTYTPSERYHGLDRFTVQISDGHGGVTTVAIDLTVTPVNHAPDANDPANGDWDAATGSYRAQTPQNTPRQGVVHAGDIDGDTLAFTLATTPTHGRVSLDPSTGAWTYVPEPGYAGKDPFVVQVSDGHGGTTQVTVEVTVTPTYVLPAPKGAPPTQPVPERASPITAIEAAPSAPVGPTFDSTLHPPTGSFGNALRTLPDQVAAPHDAGLPGITPAPLDDIYTRPSGFRVMVTPASEPSLRTFRGVDDQVVPLGRQVSVQLPADTFVHTQVNESIQLQAQQANGQPLPAWLHFDGKSGSFDGQPPTGWNRDIAIRVVARDSEGREAITMFRIKVGDKSSGPGASLSRQLQLGEAWRHGGLGWQAERLSTGGRRA